MIKKKSLTGNTFLGDLVRDTTGQRNSEQIAHSEVSISREESVESPAKSNEMIKVTFRYRPDQIAAMRILGFVDRYNSQQDYIHKAIDTLLAQKEIKALLEEGEELYIRYLEKKSKSGKKLNEIDRYIYARAGKLR